jgi:hypothetical protein
MKIIKTKNWYKIAQSNNPLDGKTNQQARNIVNKIIPNTPGFYSDESWQGVKQIFNAFDNANLDYQTIKSEYYHDEKGVPKGNTNQFYK